MTALRTLVVAFVAALCSSCQQSPAAPRPNIVVISLDTLRARNLGAYGYERDTSPFFDSLAARGVLFENAITTSVTTPPSHMSLFTGLTPRRHGILTGLGEAPVRPSVPRLTTALEERGYTTAAITENGFLIRELGFDVGFDEYTEHTGKKRRSAPGLVARSFGQAREWLASEIAEPYLLFVHTYQVHAPYLPPRKYRVEFERDPGGVKGATAEVRNRNRLDRYDAEIRYVDDELTQLFAAIEARQWKDGTLVVVLSDHGEEFQEHGATQHGTAVFEESIHIPLLFWGTGIPEGRRVTRQVSIVDVFPTLLEMVGVEAPSGLDGVSLLPAIRSAAEPPARPLFAEAMARRRWTAALAADDARPLRVAVRFDRRKFIVHRPIDDGPREPTLAFDLEADPLERQPIEVDAGELETVEKLVDEYLAHGKSGGGDGPALEADPALVERLRSLGYVE